MCNLTDTLFFWGGGQFRDSESKTLKVEFFFGWRVKFFNFPIFDPESKKINPEIYPHPVKYSILTFFSGSLKPPASQITSTDYTSNLVNTKGIDTVPLGWFQGF